MSKHKGNIAVLLLTSLLLAIATVVVMHGKGEGAEASGGQERLESKTRQPDEKQRMKEEFESQFPTVDFASVEPDDPEEKAKRRAKGNKHNKARIPLEEVSEDDSIFSAEDWEVGLPALPVSQSQVIILGRVSDSQAFLSTDKTAVYSEFTVVIDEVLKNDGPEQLKSGGVVVADRSGGRVRFPSGSVTLSQTQGQGMPRAGRQYVFFLARRDQEENYSILTGYELKAGRVALLDNPGGNTHPIAEYKGVEQTTFLETLRNAIAGKDNP